MRRLCVARLAAVRETALTPNKTIVVAGLGVTQTLAWASSYYLPAILGTPIAAALDIKASVFFGIFSGSLLLSAAISPYVGRLIDDHGGRAILAASNLVLAIGLAALGLVQGVVSLTVAWFILGIGMAIGLYDPAFATLTRLYGRGARAPITGITLIAGFASTVGWPVSAWLEHAFGWREACLVWAGLNLFAALPLNWWLIPPAPPLPVPGQRQREIIEPAPPRGAMPILAFYFCTTAFVTGAMAAHLPRFLEIAGASETTAIAAGALVGPAQVAARLVEFGLLRGIHPVWSARIAALMHPLAAAVLGALGPVGVAPFALLHGAGNGLVTIARGTLPLAIFGPIGYGLRTGILAAPARIALATAPFVFGLLLDGIGIFAILVSAGLSLAAFLSLWLLRSRPALAAAPAASE
ncbi:MAG TPA: MFS transporter [Stellaceae bacterium]|nr:MFS transporter [Stellaceae bacterium]